MKKFLCVAIAVVLGVLLGFREDSKAEAKRFKVLVVMSYEEDNPWCKGIHEGIERVLGPESEITFFYMNTKVAFAGGPKKAEEAYALYRQLQPQGVITADDDAQAMFVLPYLKGKVETPIMFTGVNDNAEKYGFPTGNISGTLERAHVRESLAFIQQLVPSVRNIGFLVKDSPAGNALLRQAESERDSYPAEVGGLYKVSTVDELRALSVPLGEKCQALFVDSLEGIVDERQKPLTNRQVFDILFRIYHGPVIGANRYHVEEGALCAVVKTGQEQGELAAEQLAKALHGTPVDQIPIEINYRGQRLINVNALSILGISPRPNTLQGATLVKTK
jgi:ABC-type uncharacterized transport system substrate-binding protein